MRLQVGLSVEQNNKFKNKISRLCDFENLLDECLETGDFDANFNSFSSVVDIKEELKKIEEFIQSANR